MARRPAHEPRWTGMHRFILPGLGILLSLALTGCLVSGGTQAGDRPEVVAAENVWGSIATQLGGDRLHVTSIITNPNADPHDYEPTAADARAMASAKLVIVNGMGYDPWAQRLLAANPVPGRAVLDVGRVVGVGTGGNPHQWYFPPSVEKVIRAITTQYGKLLPGQAPYFRHQRSIFESKGLSTYHRLISEIRSRYGGAPVGASESIFAPMSRALGLKLLTPPSFLSAISEGTEPTAADKAAIDHQIQSHLIQTYVYNRQNATPDIQRQIGEARLAGIPIATITETLVPRGATFQAWQVAELRALSDALHRGVGS